MFFWRRYIDYSSTQQSYDFLVISNILIVAEVSLHLSDSCWLSGYNCLSVCYIVTDCRLSWFERLSTLNKALFRLCRSTVYIERIQNNNPLDNISIGPFL